MSVNIAEYFNPVCSELWTCQYPILFCRDCGSHEQAEQPTLWDPYADAHLAMLHGFVRHQAWATWLTLYGAAVTGDYNTLCCLSAPERSTKPSYTMGYDGCRLRCWLTLFWSRHSTANHNEDCQHLCTAFAINGCLFINLAASHAACVVYNSCFCSMQGMLQKLVVSKIKGMRS